MSNASPSDRTRDRAARLRREARNCVDIAVREREEGHAAELIDEAVRLVRRAVELAKD